MKTEVILSREFANSEIRQLSKCGFLCATDLTSIYNVIRVSDNLPGKRMKDFFENLATKDFLESLCNELNLQEKAKGGILPLAQESKPEKIAVWSPADLKVVKRGKNNKGTWLHPYLFVKYAMWLSPVFEAKMIIWLTDNLLGYRNQSGDDFKSCNAMIDKVFNVGDKYWVYADIASFVAARVLGNSDKEQWNNATAEQLQQRSNLLQRIENVAEFGKFGTPDKLLAAL
jgi:hypothetical protein